MILSEDSKSPDQTRECTGWSGPSLSAYAWKHIFRMARPIYSKYSDRQTWANGADPDHTPQNAASDLGLHFLHLTQQV